MVYAGIQAVLRDYLLTEQAVANCPLSDQTYRAFPHPPIRFGNMSVEVRLSVMVLI
jgi:hypothetical protein